MVEKYLNRSELWKKFLRDTGLTSTAALKLGEDLGSYIGGEPHVYSPIFIKDEYKRRINYQGKELKFSLVCWPYQRKIELYVEYEAKEERIEFFL